MQKKKDPLLLRAAEKARVSYGHARLVACGNRKSHRVMRIILQLKEQELEELRASILREATTDFNQAS